jgi:hypothetical protein
MHGEVEEEEDTAEEDGLLGEFGDGSALAFYLLRDAARLWGFRSLQAQRELEVRSLDSPAKPETAPNRSPPPSRARARLPMVPLHTPPLRASPNHNATSFPIPRWLLLLKSRWKERERTQLGRSGRKVGCRALKR